MAAKPSPNKRFHAHEAKPENRSEAERDHDRILYTAALQRLAGITQIAAPESGAPIHNRLTHTLKVAQVARRLAKRLGLDVVGQETAAAAALAHDLGHPPFGHLAETALQEQAASWGGFQGNAQSFRIVNYLALRTTDYRGLNLTRRTLNGILKYPWKRDLVDKSDKNKKDKWGAYEAEETYLNFAREGASGDEPSLEAAIMDWADDVTYAVHDVEDFFRLGLIPLDRLGIDGSEEAVRFFDSFFVNPDAPTTLRDEFNAFEPDDLRKASETLFKLVFGTIEPYRGSKLDRTTLRGQTSYLIGNFVQAVSRSNGALTIDPEQHAQVLVLKELAWFYVIKDPSLATIQRGQRKVITDLHETYIQAANDEGDGWQLFPLAQREMLRGAQTAAERNRLATDFVAGLTEAMAYELHHRLTGTSRGSIFDAAARAGR